MAPDSALDDARAQVERVLGSESARPVVQSFFDEATFTATHVVHDPASKAAAVVDSVMDFDPSSGRTSFANADKVIDHVRAEGLTVQWLLETHVHADHLSAAPYLQQKLGGAIAIGAGIRAVQRAFEKIFNEGPGFACDGSQFDRLFEDGDRFAVGDVPAIALHVPGHTPADAAFLIGDALFVGDTMFMPDYGTARCDFPGGDARQLYRSIRRLLELPSETRIFLCHDYQTPERPFYSWETKVADQRVKNIQVHDGIGEQEFVDMRTSRDATLKTPKLLLPSIQVNMRAGRFPEPEENGTSYLKTPLNLL